MAKEPGLPTDYDAGAELTLEELKDFIKKYLGEELIGKADAIVAEMRKHPEHQGKGGMYLEIPHREELKERVFLPEFQRFVDLVRALPVSKEMTVFSEESEVPLDFNVRSTIFTSKHYLLRSSSSQSGSASDSTYRKNIRTEAQYYRGELQGRGDFLPEELGIQPWPIQDRGDRTRYYHQVLNPLIFERTDSLGRAALKILDNMFQSEFDRGSSLELGPSNVYTSGSFQDAFAERLQFATNKWRSMSPEEKQAWAAGKFTESGYATSVTSPDSFSL